MRWIGFRNVILAFLVMGAFSLVGVLGATRDTFASSKYYQNEAKCLAESGGRQSIDSVQWACGVAARQNISACSLWIGSSDSSVVPKIYVDSLTGVVPISYWGMCTDRVDTTSKIEVSGDNESIGDSGALTRGLWAQPTSLGTFLDIEKFTYNVTPVTT